MPSYGCLHYLPALHVPMFSAKVHACLYHDLQVTVCNKPPWHTCLVLVTLSAQQCYLSQQLVWQVGQSLYLDLPL